MDNFVERLNCLLLVYSVRMMRKEMIDINDDDEIC